MKDAGKQKGAEGFWKLPVPLGYDTPADCDKKIQGGGGSGGGKRERGEKVR
jgi:hypothetical protein